MEKKLGMVEITASKLDYMAEQNTLFVSTRGMLGAKFILENTIIEDWQPKRGILLSGAVFKNCCIKKVNFFQLLIESATFVNCEFVDTMFASCTLGNQARPLFFMNGCEGNIAFLDSKIYKAVIVNLKGEPYFKECRVLDCVVSANIDNKDILLGDSSNFITSNIIFNAMHQDIVVNVSLAKICDSSTIAINNAMSIGNVLFKVNTIQADSQLNLTANIKMKVETIKGF